LETNTVDRNVFNTAIDRELFKFVNIVKEHTYDFTHLYLRRNQMEVDPEILKTVLDVVRLGIKDGESSKVQFFHEGMRKTLDAYEAETKARLREELKEELKVELLKELATQEPLAASTIAENNLPVQPAPKAVKLFL